MRPKFKLIHHQEIISVEQVCQHLYDEEPMVFIPPRFEDLSFDEMELTGRLEATEPLLGLYSSGTTGLPKAIFNTKSNLLANADISIDVFQLRAEHRVLVVASPWHVAGLTWIISALKAGSYVEFFVPYVDQLPSLPERISTMNPTHLFIVPSALRSVYHSDWQVDELIVGGASLMADDYPVLKNRCDFLTQAYGQTEAGGLISSYRKSIQDFVADDVKNVGKTPPEFTFKLDDKELLFSSPTAAYEGFYPTGDYVLMDLNGNIHVQGRKNSGGGNCNALSGITMVAHK